MHARGDDLDLDRILRLCDIIRAYEHLVAYLLTACVPYYPGINYKEATRRYADYLVAEASVGQSSHRATALSLGLSAGAVRTRRRHTVEQRMT